MTNYDIWTLVNTLARKDKQGGLLTEDEFNLFLQQANRELFDKISPSFEITQEVTDALRIFVTNVSASVDVNGFYELPDDYGKFLTAYYNDGTRDRKVDLTTQLEFNKRSTSFLNPPTASYPMATIYERETSTDNARLYFSPLTSETAEITYLRVPNEPYLDYYYDSDDNLVYLEEGASYTLQAGETYIDKDDGTERTSGYTITSGENKTVELEWDDNEKDRIVYNILQKVGVRINEQDALQYGISKENE